MTMIGTSVHPLTNLSPIVGELAAAKLSQMAAFQAALTAAPIVTRGSRKGTFVKDATYRGLDLSKAPNAATAANLYAKEYPSQGVAYGTGNYEIERFLVDSIEVPDAVLAEWQELAGFNAESRVADLLAERVGAVHSYNTWATLGNDSLWASGFKADPGNITSASFSIITLLNTVRTALIKGQKWTPGSPIDVFIADDCYLSLQLLTEVRARLAAGQPTSTIPTFDEIAGFFAAYLPGANVVQVYSTHTAASGTVTFDFSGKMLFKPRRAGWESSALTIAPSGPTGSVSVASVRSEYNIRLPGVEMVCDGHFDVLIADNEGAYLAYDLLS
jgi:hypothetical protein